MRDSPEALASIPVDRFSTLEYPSAPLRRSLISTPGYYPRIPGNQSQHECRHILRTPTVTNSTDRRISSQTVIYSAGGILLYLVNLRDLCCGYCQILEVFRPVGTTSAGTESTASTRSSTKMLSICAVYWEYEPYFDHPSVHRRFDYFIHILLQTAFTFHGPTTGS